MFTRRTLTRKRFSSLENRMHFELLSGDEAGVRDGAELADKKTN